jgi:hypothetical protein
MDTAEELLWLPLHAAPERLVVNDPAGADLFQRFWVAGIGTSLLGEI